MVAAGRLKRCSPQQLRHCSEREKILAEASGAITLPWSFSSLLHLVEKGQFEQFDDLVDDEQNPAFRERQSRSERSTRSRSRAKSVPVKSERSKQESTTTAKEAEPRKAGSPRGERRSKEEKEGPKKEKRQKTDVGKPLVVAPQTPGAASASSHGTPLTAHPPFQRAQQRAPDSASLEKEDADLFAILEASESCPEDVEDKNLVYSVSVPLPETHREMKRFIRDSQNWVAGKMRKGAELRWHEIPKEMIPEFQKAKDKELHNWISQEAVKLIKEQVPKHRTVQMRWIYTIKSDNSAKARIVLIGYQDPDLGQINTVAPTMSRRTRGLYLTACAVFGWTALKGDVRGAFLQGLESETERNIFAKPVIELC